MVFKVLTLLSRPSKNGLSALVLPAIAFTGVSAILAIIIGGAQTFWSYTDELAETYRSFAAMALVLLVIPLVSLAQAAARLSAKRRDDRLATLRLLGMTSNEASALAIIEASSVAAVGAFSGVIISYAVTPLIGLISFRGEQLGTSAVTLPIWGAFLLTIAVTAIATVSSWISMRRVRISPLGVALKERAPKPAWVGAIIAAFGIVAAIIVMNQLREISNQDGTITAVMALIAGLGIALFAVDLIGTWVLGMFGRRKVKNARTPNDLIAARMILESPRTAWRQVSSLALTTFIAVIGGAGVALAGAAYNDVPPEYEQYMLPGEEFLNEDIRTGVLIIVIASFTMVALAVGVGQAAQVLDRAEISRSLEIMGTPIEVQQKARISATMLPLLLSAVGSAVLASVLLFPVIGFAIIVSPVSMAITLGSIAFGIFVVRVALVATSPLQASVAKATKAKATTAKATKRKASTPATV